VTADTHRQLAGEIRKILAVYREAEDLINIGAYVEGSNSDIDRAIRLMPGVRAFLQQGLSDRVKFSDVAPQMHRALRG
jgi:flagellum-specific ATP synthase